MKCPLCGAEVSKDDLFCESCGHNLIQDRPQAEQPAEPAATAAPEAGVTTEPSLVVDVQPAAEQPVFTLPADTGSAPVMPRAQDNKIWLWIAIAVIVLIVLLCCCCCIGVFILAAASESANNLWPGIVPFLR